MRHDGKYKKEANHDLACLGLELAQLREALLHASGSRASRQFGPKPELRNEVTQAELRNEATQFLVRLGHLPTW